LREEFADRFVHTGRDFAGGAALRIVREPTHVRRRFGIQLQRFGECDQDLVRWLVVAATLKPQVIFRADSSELGDLFPA
jgi:hypothetical protein